MSAKRATSTGAWIFLAIVSVLIVWFFIWISTSVDNSPSGISTSSSISTTEGVAEHVERKSAIDKYASQYCKKRQGTKLTGMPKGYPSNDGSGWTNKECRTIIAKLYDAGAGRDDNELELVSKGNYAMGMSELSILYSLGNPYDINTTRIGTDYVKKQFVYGDPTYNPLYIYIENGKVTAIQN